LEPHPHWTLPPSLTVVVLVPLSWSAKVRVPCGPTSTSLIAASAGAPMHSVAANARKTLSHIGEPLKSAQHATQATVTGHGSPPEAPTPIASSREQNRSLAPHT